MPTQINCTPLIMKDAERVSALQMHMPQSIVTAEGLTANPDNLHFNSQLLREFGLRYYKNTASLNNNTKNVVLAPPMYHEIREELETL